MNKQSYRNVDKPRLILLIILQGSSTDKFDDIVTKILVQVSALSTTGVCYVHVNCTRNNYSWCLDWREICDGKVDCWPEPVDEEQCYELEQNKCDEEQYRCRNGQCIPQEYVMDNLFDPDCIDNTDERLPEGHVSYPERCSYGDPSIRCSDTSGGQWFSSPGAHCSGLGSCRVHHRLAFDSFLVARASNLHLSDKCWLTMICLTLASTVLSLVSICTLLCLVCTQNNYPLIATMDLTVLGMDDPILPYATYNESFSRAGCVLGFFSRLMHPTSSFLKETIYLQKKRII